MKTTKQVISDIENESDELKKARENRVRYSDSKIKYMRLALKYLEFNPKKQSVTRQKHEVENCLSIYEERFEKFKAINPKVKVDKAMFNKAKEIDTKELLKWRSELKFLNYILS